MCIPIVSLLVAEKKRICKLCAVPHVTLAYLKFTARVIPRAQSVAVTLRSRRRAVCFVCGENSLFLACLTSRLILALAESWYIYFRTCRLKFHLFTARNVDLDRAVQAMFEKSYGCKDECLGKLKRDVVFHHWLNLALGRICQSSQGHSHLGKAWLEYFL